MLGITPAQVIISWHVQRGTVVLPKSVHEDRIWENFKSTFRISLGLRTSHLPCGLIVYICDVVVTLPEEHFDLIERAAVSKPPQRTANPRSVNGTVNLSYLLSLFNVARNGVSTTTSSLEW